MVKSVHVSDHNRWVANSYISSYPWEGAGEPHCQCTVLGAGSRKQALVLGETYHLLAQLSLGLGFGYCLFLNLK